MVTFNTKWHIQNTLEKWNTELEKCDIQKNTYILKNFLSQKPVMWKNNSCKELFFAYILSIIYVLKDP